jgi:hypothetical protein
LVALADISAQDLEITVAGNGGSRRLQDAARRQCFAALLLFFEISRK